MRPNLFGKNIRRNIDRIPQQADVGIFMIIKSLKNRKEIIAGDKTVLRELLHGPNEKLAARYSLARAVVKAGESSTSHKLKTSEAYYVLAGKGRMSINNESADVKAGDLIYIPPHAVQHIENIGSGDLAFLCIVDPAWRTEDEEVL